MVLTSADEPLPMMMACNPCRDMATRALKVQEAKPQDVHTVLCLYA